MPTHRRLSRLLMAAAAAAGVAACASGRQVYQATQDYGSPALGTDQADGDAALVSLSGAQVGSDRILQLSGNVILPSRRICWDVSRVGEPGKETFTTSPSLKMINSGVLAVNAFVFAACPSGSILGGKDGV